MIIGGSMTEKVTHNTFLASKKSYENFELEFDIKLEKGTGFMNSGIQVRSIRIPNNHEMKGYQVDAGIGWWGKIYDESRRGRVIAEPVDPAALAKVVKDWDWNHYRILCEGPRIRSWINGVPALDFTERAPGIPQNGIIGFQAHGGGSFDYTVFEPARDQGFGPDTISSDLHAVSGNTPGLPFLPWVMSKFLNNGYPLEQVVEMATVKPARVIDRVDKLGTLQRNLILSHATGVGEPLPIDVSQLAFALRIHNLARGYSGVRPELAFFIRIPGLSYAATGQ